MGDTCDGGSSFDGGGCTSFSTDTGCESNSYFTGNDHHSSGVISLPTDHYNSIDDSVHHSQEFMNRSHSGTATSSTTPGTWICISVSVIVAVAIIIFVLFYLRLI